MKKLKPIHLIILIAAIIIVDQAIKIWIKTQYPIGEVVRVHVADGLANERLHVHADLLRAVGRMGGSDYCTTRERAPIPAGHAALGHSVGWQAKPRG